jgi:asparagine synthase (glutamine-hydrolysing)
VDRLAGRTILDCACGTGVSSVYFALKGARVEAFDASAKAIEIGRQSAALSGVAERISFSVQDAQRLGYPSAHFDGVYCQSALHILVDYPDCPKELARVVKPGARVVFCEEPLAYNPLLIPIRWWRRRRFKACGGRTLSYSDLRRFGAPFAETRIHHFNLFTQVRTLLGDRAGIPWVRKPSCGGCIHGRVAARARAAAAAAGGQGGRRVRRGGDLRRRGECVMCGICGVFSLADGRPDLDLVRRMAGSLAHRGPDGDGFYDDASLAFGHRRLSIIDLATGDQPIFNEDRTLAIVFNGEIYNYKELREDLLRKGHRLSTAGDTEVIVHLYEEKGIDCVRDLNGMFAFALWDAPRRQLFLARDALGEKPLYYTTAGRQFLFGSELKALLQCPKVSREIDPAALDDYLAYGYIPAPRTIYRSVFKLPAAHRLVVRQDGGLELSRYWHPWSGERLDVSEQEASRELARLLADAVRLRLRSDVPVGAFLSGGIDSSLIVALAAQQTPALRTFSVRIQELGFDESPYARLVAERFRTQHQEIEVAVPQLDELPMLARQFDEPFADPSAVPTYYVTQAASRHLKVCLSGDGGDELFGGYSQHRQSWLERMLPGPVPALGGVARALPQHLPGVGLLTRMSVSGAERHHAMVGLFSPEERRAFLQPRYRAAVNGQAWLLAEAHGRTDLDEIERRMLADQLSYLPEDVLVKVDRDAMKNSLEVRVPFLDPRLVHFANALPLRFKVDGSHQKRLLRTLLAEIGLPELLDRPKQGFGLPLKSWLWGRLSGEVERLLLADDARIASVLDMGVVRRFLDQSRKRGRDLTERVWALFWLEHWLRECESSPS